MIPKRAFFTWVGDGPLPWLRQLSMDTFRKYNPDWEAELIRLPAREGLRPAQVTDIFRYGELAEHGGLYLDTDIVFFRPVPDAVLECDFAVTIDKSAFRYDRGSPLSSPLVEHMPGFNNLAFLGSCANSQFFEFARKTAEDRLAWLRDDDVDVKKLMYQAFGVELLNRSLIGKTEQEIAEEFGGDFYNVPLDMVLPLRWWDSHKLFNGTLFDPSEDVIGVHWYGGCVDAKRYCYQYDMDSYHKRPCYLTDAISKALA